MNCEEFRTVVGAEPSSTNPEAALHAAQCPTCARYQQELQTMDGLIYRALNVDVPAAAPRRKQVWTRPALGLAASLLVTVSLGIAIWLTSGRETFAAQLIEHVHGEPNALIRTSASVDAAQLAAILSRSGVRLKPGAAHVSYAMSCWFRGHFVPHLVVQSADGPVTVLVMPKERRRTKSERIDEDGFEGVVMPAPRGVLVVLGRNAPADAIAQTILAALEYTG